MQPDKTKVRIDLDYERLATALKPKRENNLWYSGDKLLSLCQAVALIAGGIWTVYIFLSFQKEILGVQLAKDSLDLNKMIQRQIEFRTDIELTSLGITNKEGLGIYKGAYKYSFRNKSSTNKEITSVVLELFQASILQPSKGNTGIP
jgi:hypothetical protein